MEANIISEDEALEFVESIIKTIREPIIVLDHDLRVVTASRFFFDVFKITPEETVGQLIYDLGNKQWDIPKLRELLETIFSRKTIIDDYEVEHDFADIGRRVMLFNARQIKGVAGKGRIILLAIDDITERKQAEEALRQSEEKYRTVLEDIEDGYWEVDLTGNFTFFNDSMRRIIGYPREEMMGMNNRRYTDKENTKKLFKIFNKVYRTGEPAKGFDWQTIRKDGTKRYIEGSASLKRNISGKPIGFRGISRDITERRAAEEALRESEEKYRTILEEIEDVYYEVALNGDFTVFNNSLCRILGYTKEELMGMNNRRYTDEQNGKKLFQTFNEVYRTGKPTQLFDWQVIRKDGTKRNVEASVSPIKDSSDKPIGFRGIVRDITGRKRAEAERERLMAAIEQVGEVIMITDPDGAIQYVNPAFEEVSGYSREEAIGQKPRIFKSGRQDDMFYQQLWKTITSGRTWSGRTVNRKKDGALYTEDVTISPVFDVAGQIINYVAAKRDVTAHLQMASQLLQAQKMESVGRLAGGVAHDYNNMLSVILGYTEMAMEQVDPAGPLHADLTEVYNAAKRSMDITGQLLAFARKQVINPQVIDLNKTMEGMLKMLRRLIGENIDFVFLFQPGDRLWPVRMDPMQIDQVLANLCVNAQDAIAGVGKITIETNNIAIDERYCADHAGFVPGDFVMMAVSDTGCGMDGETLENIFEPFFTTKEVGKGTGMGLATVYGIVKQNNGFINVYSEPGKGTTFRVYLPRHEGEAEGTVLETAAEIIPGRGETVLLVEDEAVIIRMGKMMLERLGYHVIAAETPADALRLASEHAGTIHLLLTDVVMPEMNGRDLADQIKTLFPDIRVLFMSGYTVNAIAHYGMVDHGVNFIAKPFSQKDLAAKIRAALE